MAREGKTESVWLNSVDGDVKWQFVLPSRPYIYKPATETYNFVFWGYLGTSKNRSGKATAISQFH